MSSEANQKGLEQLLRVSQRIEPQKYFEATTTAPPTVTVFLANQFIRTDLQVEMMLFSLGTAKTEYDPTSCLSQRSSRSLKP